MVAFVKNPLRYYPLSDVIIEKGCLVVSNSCEKMLGEAVQKAGRR